MATLEQYRNSEFVKFCEKALEEFASETNGVKNVLLATPDGFQVAFHSVVGGEHSADNLAAVGSTLFSLANSIVSEFALGVNRSLTIDADKGKVYICSVDGGEDKSLVLLLEANQKAMLAHILHSSRKLSESVGKRLSILK